MKREVGDEDEVIEEENEETYAGEESMTTANDCDCEGDDGDEVDDEAKGWKLRECGERRQQ